MSMIIDIIDTTDPELASVSDLLNAAGANSTQLTFNAMCNGTGQMVTDVQGVANAGDIEALRIWAHGMPGVQMVSGGQGYPGARQDYVAITTDNFTQLAPLAPLFSSSGHAELRGCQVGSGGMGKALLLDLASMWCVPVYGGDTDQYGVEWYDNVVCAYPNGNVLVGAEGPPVAEVCVAGPTDDSASDSGS
jgi:hypothetical protein